MAVVKDGAWHPFGFLSSISSLGKPWDKFSKALIISNYKSIVTNVNFHLHLAMLEVDRVVKTEMSIWSNYTLLPDIFTKMGQSLHLLSHLMNESRMRP